MTAKGICFLDTLILRTDPQMRALLFPAIVAVLQQESPDRAMNSTQTPVALENTWSIRTYAWALSPSQLCQT